MRLKSGKFYRRLFWTIALSAALTLAAFALWGIFSLLNGNLLEKPAERVETGIFGSERCGEYADSVDTAENFLSEESGSEKKAFGLSKSGLAYPVLRPDIIYFAEESEAFLSDGLNVEALVPPQIDLSGNRLYSLSSELSYTIYFEENGGNPVDDIAYSSGMRITLPGADQIQKSGYVFVGWYESQDYDSEVYTELPENSVGDRTFYAAWAKESSSVTLCKVSDVVNKPISFYLNGEIIDDIKFTFGYGEPLILPEAVVKGFKFEGWLYNGELVETGQNSSCLFWDDVTLTPSFTRLKNTIEIVQYFGGGNQRSCWLVVYPDETFDFFDEETSFDYYCDFSVDICVRTYLETHPDSKLFFADGLIYKFIVEAPVPPGNPEQEELKFHGNNNLGYEEHVTFYAYYDIEKYNISVNGEEAFYAMGDVITFPQMEPEEGYDLTWEYRSYSISATGANRNFTVPDLSPDLESDIIVNPAVFNLVRTPIEYSITYNLSGGETFENDKTVIDTYTIESPTFVLPAVKKENYVFTGWRDEDGNTLKSVEKGSCGDLILYPEFVLYEDYTITYVIDGGSINESGYKPVGGNYARTYTAETPDFNQPVPEKTFYSFVGWFANSALTEPAPATIESGSTGSRIYYAKWERNKATLSFSASSGYNNIMTVDCGSNMVLPGFDKDFHAGYWRASDGTTYSFGTNYCCSGDESFEAVFAKRDESLYAFYTRDDVYKIDEKSVGKQNENPCDYIVDVSESASAFYSKAKIVFYFNAWEGADGYQQVYLCSDEYETIEQLGYWQFEHGGSRKDGNAAYYEFSVEVDINKISGKKLYVSFNASGKFSDTWYNDSFGCEVYLFA